jgi:release factor glutamine methyltransferase
MRELVQRRAGHEPVAYLVGHREFFGLDFRVTAAVLIPRPDTETLVMELLDRARTAGSTRILDLCTGSGCIAVAAAVNLPQAQIVATDISKEALAVASQNGKTHAVAERIEFRFGDVFDPVTADEQFDVVVSNPPYVTASELETIQPDVRLHEPRSALDGGPDGLDVTRRLIEQAPRYLAPQGSLLIEIDPRQADAVRALLASADFEAITFVNDLTGRPRVAAATRT